MSQPIILLGAARSGTKFLRDVLAESAEISCVPYDTSYVWRYRNEDHPNDALTRAEATGTVKRFVPPTLHKMAGIGKGDDRCLLEKTVGNTLRVEFVDEIFPNARFIHLVRDGRAVTESAMRLWQMPPDWPALLRKLRGLPLSNAGYAFWFGKNMLAGLFSGRKGGKVWGPRYPGVEEDVAAGKPLEEICARQWAESVRHARTQLATLPEDRWRTVRYETLVDDPAALDDLLAFLDVGDAERVKEAFRRKAVRSNLDKWRETLTADQIATIETTAGPELDALGYRISNPAEEGRP